MGTKRRTHAATRSGIREGLRMRVSKSMAVLALAALLITALLPGQQVRAASRPAEGVLEPVLTLTIGNGPDQVAYGSPDGGAADAPQSFDVRGDGAIYIADTLNHRVLVFRQGILENTVRIPSEAAALDIQVTASGDMWLWLSSEEVLELSLQGEILSRHTLPNDLSVSGISLVKGEDLAIQLASGEEILLDSLVTGNRTARKGATTKEGKLYTAAKGTTAGSVEVALDGNLMGTLTYPKGVGGVGPLGSNKGNLYVIEYDMADYSDDLQVLVEAFDGSGKRSGVVRLPYERVSRVPRPEAVLAPNGEIYAMMLEPSTAVIYRVTLGAAFTPRFRKGPDFGIRESRSSDSTGIVPMGYPDALTRSQIMGYADNMIYYSWHYNGAANPDPLNITQPAYLSTAVTGDIEVGVPYAWGGFDSDVTRSAATWSDFGDAMNKGAFAGNTKTSGGYKAGTAGLDCSGFVGRAWTMTDYKRADYQVVQDAGKSIFWSAVDQGDAADRYNSHILLFAGKYDATRSSIATKEASLDSPAKAKNFSRTYSWLTTYSYYPYQFLYLAP